MECIDLKDLAEEHFETINEKLKISNKSSFGQRVIYLTQNPKILSFQTEFELISLAKRKGRKGEEAINLVAERMGQQAEEEELEG